MESNGLQIQFELLKEQLSDLKDENRELNKRIAKVEQSREKTEYQYDQIMKAIDDLNNNTIPGLVLQIDELKDKPGKRYEHIITTLITTITGTIIGFISAMITK